jgi:hypothetical protein
VTPTTTVTTLATVAQIAADAGDDASRRLSLVIAGLVVLAVVIAVATVVFWRLTRPEPVREGTGLRWVATEEPTVVPPAASDRAVRDHAVDRSDPSGPDGPGSAAPGGPPTAG